jgi:hypothetical protein
MPTKLNQNQIDGLSNELNSLDSIDISLESKISKEDSINDSVDVSLESSISGKQNTLVSGTNIKTINGSSILGSGNLSVSGTSNPKTLANVTGSNLTGTANQISASVLIPANTLTANNTIQINGLLTKTSGSSTSTPRIYINTTNSLTGATLLATLGGMTGTNYYQRGLRGFYFDGTNINTLAPTINNTTDFSAGVPTLVPLTITTAYYLIFAVQNTSTTPDNLGWKRVIVQIYD